LLGKSVYRESSIDSELTEISYMINAEKGVSSEKSICILTFPIKFPLRYSYKCEINLRIPGKIRCGKVLFKVISDIKTKEVIRKAV
jgi:hypothetical protein